MLKLPQTNRNAQQGRLSFALRCWCWAGYLVEAKGLEHFSLQGLGFRGQTGLSTFCPSNSCHSPVTIFARGHVLVIVGRPGAQIRCTSDCAVCL